jgi:DNA-binding NtrC family response regulator
MGEHPIRLLVVDDEPELLQVLEQAFCRRGMLVACTGNGAEALAAISERVFDVVLLDLKMPGMDGVEVLERIKRLQPLAEVIVLTGHPSMELAMECLRLGAFEFLMKPQRLEALAAKIRQAYSLRQLRCSHQQQQASMGC